MRNKLYILFDLDGTITDPFEGITKAVVYALSKFDIVVTDRNELVSFIGPPLRDSFMAYAGLTQQQADEAIRAYRQYYSAKGLYDCYVYKGIPELFNELWLAGKKVVLATSKPECFAFDLMEHFNLSKYFCKMYGASLDYSRANKIDVIQAAIYDYKIDVSQAVMVGDRKYDILGASAFGMDSIGVSYGYGSVEELKSAGANVVCESIEQLHKILLN